MLRGVMARKKRMTLKYVRKASIKYFSLYTRMPSILPWIFPPYVLCYVYKCGYTQWYEAANTQQHTENLWTNSTSKAEKCTSQPPCIPVYREEHAVTCHIELTVLSSYLPFNTQTRLAQKCLSLTHTVQPEQHRQWHNNGERSAFLFFPLNFARHEVYKGINRRGCLNKAVWHVVVYVVDRLRATQCERNSDQVCPFTLLLPMKGKRERIRKRK